MLVCGLHLRPQIRFGSHVADRVMNEHHVEGAAESERANVALDVLALWVELPTHREHLRRKIHQGHREMRLEVERAVASARTKLEHSAGCRLGRLAEDPHDVSRFSPALPRITEDRPPLPHLAAEPHITQRSRTCT